MDSGTSGYAVRSLPNYAKLNLSINTEAEQSPLVVTPFSGLGRSRELNEGTGILDTLNRWGRGLTRFFRPRSILGILVGLIFILSVLVFLSSKPYSDDIIIKDDEIVSQYKAIPALQQDRVIPIKEFKPPPPPSSLKGKKVLSWQSSGTLGAGYMNHIEWSSGGEDGSYVSYEGRGRDLYIKHIEHQDKSESLMDSQKLVNPDTGKLLNTIESYKISADRRYILLMGNSEKEWRYSSFSNAWIYSLADKKVRSMQSIFVAGVKSTHMKGVDSKLSLAVWSPAGSSLAWVRGNNLYVTLENLIDVQLTYDGSPDILNGISDWVYEEEVFSSNVAAYFSPDASYLAFLKFNDTLVRVYPLQYFRTDNSDTYPREIPLKYPKPGTPNPTVSLFISDLRNASLASHESAIPVEIHLPDLDDADKLITEVKWVGSSLLVRVMNRVQDSQYVYLISRSSISGRRNSVKASRSADWIVKLARKEKTPDKAWYQHIKSTVPYGNGYLELTDVPSDSSSTDTDGYTHIAFYEDAGAAKPTRYLTSGPWEVDKIECVEPYQGGSDDQSARIFYTSTEHGSTNRHLYSVAIDGTGKTLLSTHLNAVSQKSSPFPPLTISHPAIAEIPGGGYFSASFSAQCGYVLINDAGPGLPSQRILSTRHEWSTVPVGSVSGPEQLAKQVANYALPQAALMTVHVGGGVEVNVRIWAPPGADLSGRVKYPLMMHSYGGPNSQSVSQKYEMGLMPALTSIGICTVVVDGRGTGFRGRAFRSIVSGRLGEFEAADQIAVAKVLGALPFIDASKIGFWGWSYGGYLTAKVLEANSGVITLGVSVAPITDWLFYDTIYTERYLKTPQSNDRGYAKSAVKDMIGFAHAHFLLIHGTGDDNVHFQHSASLMYDLTAAGLKGYEVQVFPDSDHSMSSPGAHFLVFAKMVDFLREKWWGVVIPGVQGIVDASDGNGDED